MDLHIERVDWMARRTELLRIRYRVFVDEQGVPVELEQDAHDPKALHLLAGPTNHEPVACARLLSNGQIGRLAVLPDWRGHGIGGALLQESIRIAEARGQGSVFLYAQCEAEPFYQRFGFIAAGEIFEEAGIDHRRMLLPLTGERQQGA